MANRILFILLLGSVVAGHSLAAEIDLSPQDLEFLKAIRQETLGYISEQKAVAKAFKNCLKSNKCNTQFEAFVEGQKFPLVFQSKEDVLDLTYRMYEKFRILGAVRNKGLYQSAIKQGLGFINPIVGYPVLQYKPGSAYGRQEMGRILKIINEDEKTKVDFVSLIFRNSVEGYKAERDLEALAIDTYEVQLTQIVAALPVLSEVLFLKMPRGETQLPEDLIISGIEKFEHNLVRSEKAIQDMQDTNVVETFLFASMVNNVLAKNSKWQSNYDKLSQYALKKKSLMESLKDKFTNRITWIVLGCFAGSIFVPKAAPLIVGVCGGLGLGAMSIMATRTALEIYKISPLVKVGLVDPSNLEYLQSILTHQVIMSFLMGLNAVPNIIRLSQAKTFRDPVIYYGQMLRDLISKEQSKSVWRTYVNTHVHDGGSEFIKLAQRFTKMNAKDLVTRVSTSKLYSMSTPKAAGLAGLGLFEIVTLADSLRMQMMVL